MNTYLKTLALACALTSFTFASNEIDINGKTFNSDEFISDYNNIFNLQTKQQDNLSASKKLCKEVANKYNFEYNNGQHPSTIKNNLLTLMQPHLMNIISQSRNMSEQYKKDLDQALNNFSKAKDEAAAELEARYGIFDKHERDQMQGQYDDLASKHTALQDSYAKLNSNFADANKNLEESKIHLQELQEQLDAQRESFEQELLKAQDDFEILEELYQSRLNQDKEAYDKLISMPEQSEPISDDAKANVQEALGKELVLINTARNKVSELKGENDYSADQGANIKVTDQAKAHLNACNTFLDTLEKRNQELNDNPNLITSNAFKTLKVNYDILNKIINSDYENFARGMQIIVSAKPNNGLALVKKQEQNTALDDMVNYTDIVSKTEVKPSDVLVLYNVKSNVNQKTGTNDQSPNVDPEYQAENADQSENADQAENDAYQAQMKKKMEKRLKAAARHGKKS